MKKTVKRTENGITDPNQTCSLIECDAETAEQIVAKIAFQLIEVTAALGLFHRHMQDLEDLNSGGVDAIQRLAAMTATDELLSALRSSGFQADKHSATPSVNFPGVGAVNSIASERSSLTLREKQVLDLIIKGATSKEGGLAIKISRRTFEGHRARIMQKLQAKNVADLVLKGLGSNVTLARPRLGKRKSN